MNDMARENERLREAQPLIRDGPAALIKGCDMSAPSDGVREALKAAREWICDTEDENPEEWEIVRQVDAALTNPAGDGVVRARALEEAAREVVAAQTMRGGYYTGWNITALNKAIERVREALGMEPTPLSPETRRMMDAASKNRAALSANDGDAG